jgi:hypothetical protein
VRGGDRNKLRVELDALQADECGVIPRVCAVPGAWNVGARLVQGGAVAELLAAFGAFEQRPTVAGSERDKNKQGQPVRALHL